jgi:hypothetical protein
MNLKRGPNRLEVSFFNFSQSHSQDLTFTILYILVLYHYITFIKNVVVFY